MKDIKETKQRPTLEKVQNELKGVLAGAAIVMNECIYTGCGNRMLGLPEDVWPSDYMDAVQLENTIVGRYLPVYYTYAYEGRLLAGYEDEIFRSDRSLERLSDFMQIFRSDDSYFDNCTEDAGLTPGEDTGHVRDMLDRLHARWSLDEGMAISLKDIALLADMSERSVRNALTATGPGRLEINDNNEVENAEARRWLEGRRGFVPTERRAFPDSLKECPDTLDPLEIPSFVFDRIEKRFFHQADSTDGLDLPLEGSDEDGRIPSYLQRAARIAQLPAQALQKAIDLPLEITPQDCPGIARAIAVDPVWFTLQVMQALYPVQMDMVLNPSHYRGEASEGQVEGKSVEVILTEAMIKHGYLDVPAHAKVLFPEDCFGTRATDDKGQAIELRYGDHVEATDMRVKSEQTISPRKRFTAWFQKELSASPGDRVRLSRIADRVFELSHLPK